MGFFNFVKNLGRKFVGTGKLVIGKSKDLLKTGVSIGNKIMNNPITKRVIDIATPFLGATPIGRGVLVGVKGAQKGLQLGEKLLEGIEAGERVAKNIQKVREGDLGAVKNIVSDVKEGIEKGKEIKYGLDNFS